MSLMDNVTILFADIAGKNPKFLLKIEFFIGFTKMSSNKTADELVSSIRNFITSFYLGQSS